MKKDTLKTIERIVLWILVLVSTSLGHSNYQDYIMLAGQVGDKMVESA